MKISGWEVRIIFILVLGLLGTFAFNDFTPSPLCGLTGLGIAVIAVILQMMFVKVPMDELVYATVGAVIGLVAGILVLTALRLAGVSRDAGNVTPLVMIPFALSYVFAHVAYIKGKKTGLLKVREETETVSAMPMVVDISAMIDGRIADLVLAGLVRGPFIVASNMKTRLTEMIESGDIIERGRGKRGLETLERLEEAAGDSGGIEFRDFGKADRERFRILEFLRKEKASLISNDAELVDVAMKEGGHVINLAEVGPAARPVILPGEVISLKLLRRGRNPRQAVGFTEDGTMVVVEDAEDFVGDMVTVEAHTTFRSSGGTMVFARLKKENEGTKG